MNKSKPNLSNLKPHPYANIFPYIEGDEFEEFVEDIRAHGLQEKIILLDGMILDGRNRYKALKRLKEFGPKHFIDYEYFCKLNQTSQEPIDFVLSRNLQRRQLDETQRAMVGAKLATLRPGQGKDTKAANLPDSKPLTQKEAAEIVNVSERSIRDGKKVLEQGAPEVQEAVERGEVKVSAAALLAELSPEEQADIILNANPKAIAKVEKKRRDDRTQAKKDHRAAREQKLGEKQQALPDKRYGVIYADPEWKDAVWSEKGKNKSPENHYPTSTLEVIKSRPVGDIAAKDCVLFLWTPRKHFNQALQVVEAWGFEFKTFLVWRKTRMGNGFWARDNAEALIIATKGKPPCIAMGEQDLACETYRNGKHSEKPDEYRQWIERHFKTMPKIELNARVRYQGWDVWGNEAPDAEEPERTTLPAKKPDVDKLAEAKKLLAADDQPSDAIYRSVPKGPTPKEILAVGDLIEITQGGETEQHRVLGVNGPYKTGADVAHYSVNIIAPHLFKENPKRKQTGSYVPELVAVNGAIMSLHADSDLVVTKIEGGAE